MSGSKHSMKRISVID